MLVSHRNSFFLALSLLLLTAVDNGPAYALADNVLQVKAMSGAKMRALLNGDPASAKANIILLVGGQGVLKISGKGQIKKPSQNFLVRTRELFADAGYLTALVDAPMDRRKPPGLLGGFRASNEHAKDLAKIVKKLNALNGKPVIVVGTSRGTVSAANIALRDESGFIKAAVLTSSLVKPNKKGKIITDLPMDLIKVPMLFVHNRGDKCKVTLLKRLKPVVKGLKKSAAKVELVIVKSKKKTGGHCKGLSPHGFLGIEGDVIGKITNWIGKLL